MIIAIDGPAASGKGTIGRRIAEHFGLPHLDTGLLYRAVARDVLAAGAALDDEAAAEAKARQLDPASLDDPGLRHPRVGDAASLVARFPSVRRALLEMQRTFARQPGGAVLDGRDIGSVVCPDADVKLFVTATLEERARRRTGEQRARGEAATYAEVLEIIRNRDRRDMERADAPLRQMPDALLLDTTLMAIDEAFEAAVGLILRKIGRPDVV